MPATTLNDGSSSLGVQRYLVTLDFKHRSIVREVRPVLGQSLDLGLLRMRWGTPGYVWSALISVV